MRFSRSALGAILLLATSAGASGVQTQVVNGLSELGEPSTVGLIQGTAPEDGFLVCSGVLIGCDSVITSAHCFNTNTLLKTHIYIPHAGFHEIESATRHPAYVDAIVNKPPGWIDTSREEDISFVKLVTPVVGVTPATINWDATPALGTPGFVVGFGRDPVTEAGAQNPGIKRSGWMQTAACEGTLAGLDVLCWSPSEPLPPPGDEVSTCSGDSGGPLFTDSAGDRVVAGITKGAIFDPQGQPDPCLPPVDPYDVNVYRHRSWIGGADGAGGMVAATAAIPLATQQCAATGQLPEVLSMPGPCDGSAWGPGEPARTCGFDGALGGANPTEGRYSFAVPADTATLRVAVNGFAESSGWIDGDLYLRHGAPAETFAHDCASAGDGTLGFCEIAAPTAGTWHVLVNQETGEGDHQVVVTLLTDAPGVPLLAPASQALLAALIAAVAAQVLARSPRSIRRRDRPAA